MQKKKAYQTIVIIGGLLLCILGIVCNQWWLASVFSPDGDLNTFTKFLIWGWEAGCIAIGLFLLIRQPNIGREVVVSIFALTLFFGVLEGGIRGFYGLKHRLSGREKSLSMTLGWANVGDVQHTTTLPGFGEISYSTTRDGFRAFGDVDTAKTKFLVLGDSFTYGRTVSTGGMYYDYLQEQFPNIEIFAYGCDGYGSLQEYLILDAYIDEIEPDVILWQFSGNDLVNNDHKLESASLYQNHMQRPYYQNGKIIHLYPLPGKGLIYHVSRIAQYSTLFRFVLVRLYLLGTGLFESVESQYTPEHPDFARSIHTTSQLMAKVRERAGDIRIFAFTVDKPAWYAVYPEICREHNILYINGVAEAVQQAKDAGTAVDGAPYDLHWNRQGHAIAGQVLAEFFRKYQIFKSPSSQQ